MKKLKMIVTSVIVLAIVGSAFVKRLAQGTPEQGLEAIGEFCKSLKTAIQNV